MARASRTAKDKTRGSAGELILSLVVVSMLFVGLFAMAVYADGSNARVQRSIVRISRVMTEDGKQKTATCTGFVTSASRGEVLTARHCVGDDPHEELYVDGQESEVIRVNDMFALVRIEPMTKPPIEWGILPQVGDQVITYGYGYGFMLVLKRNVARIDGGQDIVTDGPLVPGMSGGPVVDRNGRVVGINQASSEVIGVICGVNEMRAFLASK